MSKAIFFLSLIPLIVSATQDDDEKLIFVYSHFRHGARGPVNEVTEEGVDLLGFKWLGPDDLSRVGMRQHYLLGCFNKKRYKALFPDGYDPREIFIISSNYNRTIQSALAQLQGLFPPGTAKQLTEEQSSSQYSWPPYNISGNLYDAVKQEKESLGTNPIKYGINPIPVHVFNQKEHRFLLFEASSESGCKSNTKVQKKNLDSLEIVNKQRTFGDNYGTKIVQYIKDTVGKDFEKQKSDIYFQHIFCDTFIADYYDGRDLTKLYNYGLNKEDLIKDCKDLLRVYFEFQRYGDKNRNILRLSMSPILSESFAFIDRRIERDIAENETSIFDFSSPKYVMVSGHDVSVEGLLLYIEEAFNFPRNWELPVFATSLYFEVYRKKSSVHQSENDYKVKYVLNDKVLGEFDYVTFKETLKKNMWTEEKIKTYCEFEDENDFGEKKLRLFYILLLIPLVIITLGLIIGIIVTSVKCVKEKQKKNSENNDDDKYHFF